MGLVHTKEMFNDAYINHYSVGAFNVDSIAMCQAVLKAADELSSPIILSISRGSREFMHPGNIKDLINIISKDIKIPFAIHLDHGTSFEICKEVIDEGFTSVMIDTGDVSFKESIEITKKVVEYAHAHGATVEGELGPVKDILNQNPKYYEFTSPVLAKQFVEETNVDSLAVSVGTKHGSKKFDSKESATLRFDILEEIEKLLPGFPLVLHGSSSIDDNILKVFNNNGGKLEGYIGVPRDLLVKASQTNVCKINIGTDFRVTYVGALRKALNEKKDRFEPRNFLSPARDAVYELVKDKIKNEFLSYNKAI